MTERHLICHIWPGSEHNTWRRTVQHLRARWSLFTGRREISIAVDDTTVDPGEVIDAFDDCDASFRIVGNNKALGEGVSFPSLLRSIANEPGQTFYCHSKGSSYPPCSLSERWADVMFHLCLDYPGLVGAALQDADFAGSCRRIENRMGVPWHYSGTFFWFKNRQPWPFMVPYGDPLTSDRTCVERWPAENCQHKRSADLGLADCRNLYDEINWRSWITMRFRKEILWNEQRKAERAACGTRWDLVPDTEFEPLEVVYAENRK